MLSFVACKNDEGKTDPPAEDPKEEGMSMADIAGEWVSQSISVKVNSLAGGETDTLIEADESTYPDVLGIKANYSVLNADGTYEDTYILLNDSIETGSGTWSLGEGTITFSQEVPNNRVHTYKMEIDAEGIMNVNGKVDFDTDGEQDDDFSGKSYKRQ